MGDGRIQHVNYEANDITGNVATVTGEGTASYPDVVGAAHPVVGHAVAHPVVAHAVASPVAIAHPVAHAVTPIAHPVAHAVAHPVAHSVAPVVAAPVSPEANA